jgi:hypothetical protein
MKSIFSYCNVNYAEWQYFNTLSDADKVQYMFDIYEAAHQKGTDGIDLSKFFENIKETLIKSDVIQAEATVEDGNANADRVDVMIDDENIMIESNSLKALRFVSLRFMESGYILQRDKDTEKMFRKDKVTRYLRVYRIVDQVSGICIN